MEIADQLEIFVGTTVLVICGILSVFVLVFEAGEPAILHIDESEVTNFHEQGVSHKIARSGQQIFTYLHCFRKLRGDMRHPCLGSLH